VECIEVSFSTEMIRLHSSSSEVPTKQIRGPEFKCRCGQKNNYLNALENLNGNKLLKNT
jgi:hypothetical protein